MSSLIQSSGLTSYTVPGGKLVDSKSGNAATISLKRGDGTDPSPIAPMYVGMRANAVSGALFEGRAIVTSPSFTISSGSTFGVPSGDPFVIYDLLIDDAGTFRIGSIVCSTATSLFSLDESSLISSTAEGGAGGADAAGVVYTDVAVTSKPFRILGKRTYESGLATAGAWNVDPVVQMFGIGIRKPGEPIKIIENLSTATAKGITTWGDALTLPINTQGDQYFSTSITPASAANWILHDVLIYADSIPATVVCIALFQTGNSNAISGAMHRSSSFDPAAVIPKAMPLRHKQLSRSTSTLTFTIRGGTEQGNRFAMNQLYVDATNDSYALLGGTIASGHRMTEIQG